MTVANDKNNNDFGVIFWTHLILIFLIYSSPFLINWRLILFSLFIYYLQFFIIGNCLLTILQFRERHREVTFHDYYLSKLGFNLDKRKMKLAINHVVPLSIFAIAIFWQILINKTPLIF